MVEEIILGNGASKKANWDNFFDAQDQSESASR